MPDAVEVLIADDSPFVCSVIRSHLEAAGLNVVGVAQDGQQALDSLRELRPDVITLDLEMPDMNGLEVLRTIMRLAPTPVVIITGAGGRAATMTMQALDDGAVDFVLKFDPDSRVDPESLGAEIVAKVRAAALVRVIRTVVARGTEGRESAVQRHTPEPLGAEWCGSELCSCAPGGVVIAGASTGGPEALRELLRVLPVDFPGAVIVIQHLPASFTGVLAAQLNKRCAIHVRESRLDDDLVPGTALIAPGDFHLLIDSRGRIELTSGPEVRGHRPSIDVTMQAAANALGPAVQGVLLTGMGDDGVEGLSAIRTRGGRTYAQEPETCVVPGMPQRAIDRGTAQVVDSPLRIGELVLAHAKSLAGNQQPMSELASGMY